MARSWRRCAPWLLGCLAVLLVAWPGSATIKLVLEGRPVPTRGALMLIGTGLGISVAVVAEELGIEVDESAWPVVQLRAGERLARIESGKTTAVLDGRAVQLQAAPTVHDGMLYVPLHLVADLAGLRVDWDLLAGVLTLQPRGVPAAVGTAQTSYPGDEHAYTARPVAGGVAVGSRSSSALAPVLPVPPAREPLQPAPGSALSSDPVHPSMKPVSPEPPAPLVGEPWPEAWEYDSPAGTASSAPEPSQPSPPASLPLPAESEALAPALPGPVFPSEGAVRLAQPEGTEAGALLDVRVREVDGRTELVAITDGPMEVRAMYLPGPDRLVIDLPGAALATDWREMPVDDEVMHQLRLSGEEGGVRLVADLTGPTGYTLLPADEHPGFIVRLNHQLRAVDATTLDGGGIALHAEVSGGPVAYQAFSLREPWRVVVDLLGVTVAAPWELQLNSPLVRTVRLSQFQQDVVRAVLELGGPVDWPADGVAGQAHPGPDGRITLVFEPDGSVALDAPAPSGAANGLEFVGFVREDDAELILLQTEAPLEAEVRRLRDPERIVLDLPGVLLERSLGPLSPPGSQVVTAVRAGQVAPSTGRVVVETRQVAEHHVIFSEDRTRAVLAVRPSQLGGRTVVVDAGHGGRDPGAIGPGGTQEKDVNLAIALQVARLLEQAGARVILTRDRDVFVDLATRSRMANALGADVFVSIHADAIGPGRTASGTGTFYHPGSDEDPASSANLRFGQAVHRELLRAIGLSDRGLRQRAFHVLVHTEMPAVLVEVAFIDNPVEEHLLTDPEFQRRAALGIAQGVLHYFAEGRSQPVPRTIAERDEAVQQVAAAFLENGDLPSDVMVVAPAAALGDVSETVAKTP